MINITITGYVGQIGNTTYAKDIQHLVEAQGHRAVILQDDRLLTDARRKQIIAGLRLGRLDVLITTRVESPESGA